MKRVTAIVRPEKMEPLKDALFAADVKGMTISQVHGCGALPHFEKPAIVNKGISKFLLGKL